MINIHKTYSVPRGMKSIKHYILLSFFLVSIVSGITVTLIFHNVIVNALIDAGIQHNVIRNIESNIVITSSIVIVIGVIAILCFAFYIARKITKPISELTEGTIDIADGKLDRRINIYNYNELNQLADGFNYMAEHIETTLMELQAAKDYNDNILVSVPSILIVLNNQLDILSTNVAFEKIHKQYPSLTLNDFTANIAADIQKNMDTGKTIHNEIVVVPAGTQAKLIFVSTVSFIGDDESISDIKKARVLLTLTDITERRKMKELVMQSMRDWEDTFNTIPDMITIHDMDFNILQANKAAKEVLALEGVDLTQQTKCFKHYHGMDERPKACPSCDCLKTGLPITFEIFEPHLGKYIEIRSIPRITKDNDLIGQIHIARDISDRKKIEDEHAELLKAVTKAKIEWEMTFDSAVEHIVIIDKDLLITRCNKSFSDYLNRPLNNIIGHKCYEFFPCSGETAKNCILCLKNSEELPIKSEVKTPSGRWLYVSHRPIKDEKGMSSQSIIIATDISEIKNTQEKLNDSREALNNKVSDLERFYNMAIGRELKMKQLKKEIKKLNASLKNLDINKNEYIEQ